MSESSERCQYGGGQKPNGNCTKPAEDGYAVQCVGSWAEKKHEHLQKYINATRAVRAKYLPPKGTGGACFIDLFAGPGRARLHNRSLTVLGSPLLALEHREAPFSKVILCDLEAENVSALRERTRSDSDRVVVFDGDSNKKIEAIAQAIPTHGLNIAFIDPYGPNQFKWKSIARLGSLKRMDLLVHFPTNAVKRNFVRLEKTTTIDEMVGTKTWRSRARAADETVRLIDVLREQLVTLGYQRDWVRDVAVNNSSNGLLYHLVFASKDDQGTKIWKSITQHDGKQPRLL